MKKLLLFILMLCSLSLFGASPTFQQSSNIVSMVMSNKTGRVNINGTLAAESLRITNLADLASATLSSTLTAFGNSFHGAASYFNTITSSNTASFLGAISTSGAATLNGTATFNALAVQPQITLPATLHFNGSRQWYVTNLLTGSIAVIITNTSADTIYRLVVDSTGGDGTSAVTFSGHASPGLADTNGVSTYVILRTGSATNIWMDTKPLVVSKGAGITITTNSQFSHTWAVNDTVRIRHQEWSFDPKAVCDGTIDRLFLLSTGLSEPNGISVLAWKLSFEADPTTEVDLDLKRADAFIGVANSAVMDVLDSTAGASSEITAANINGGAVVATGKVLYLDFGTAYSEANHQVIFEMWWRVEE